MTSIQIIYRYDYNSLTNIDVSVNGVLLNRILQRIISAARVNIHLWHVRFNSSLMICSGLSRVVRLVPDHRHVSDLYNVFA
jgi:hypothetical protein